MKDQVQERLRAVRSLKLLWYPWERDWKTTWVHWAVHCAWSLREDASQTYVLVHHWSCKMEILDREVWMGTMILCLYQTASPWIVFWVARFGISPGNHLVRLALCFIKWDVWLRGRYRLHDQTHSVWGTPAKGWKKWIVASEVRLKRDWMGNH